MKEPSKLFFDYLQTNVPSLANEQNEKDGLQKAGTHPIMLKI